MRKEEGVERSSRGQSILSWRRRQGAARRGEVWLAWQKGVGGPVRKELTEEN